MSDNAPPEQAPKLPPGISNQTGFLIQRVHNYSRRVFNEALRPLGFEARHLGVLAVLSNNGPLIQRQLIELLEIDKSSLVYVIDDLEEGNLVKRRTVSHDRRAFEVHITNRGRKRLVSALEITQKTNAELFGWLKREERMQFNATLCRLIERLSSSSQSMALMPARELGKPTIRVKQSKGKK